MKQVGSHPSIRFKPLRIKRGPLSGMERARIRILKDVTRRSLKEFSDAPLDLLLGVKPIFGMR